MFAVWDLNIPTARLRGWFDLYGPNRDITSEGLMVNCTGCPHPGTAPFASLTGRLLS